MREISTGVLFAIVSGRRLFIADPSLAEACPTADRNPHALEVPFWKNLDDQSCETATSGNAPDI